MLEEYYRGKVVQELTSISKLNLENIRNQRYGNLLESLKRLLVVKNSLQLSLFFRQRNSKLWLSFARA